MLNIYIYWVQNKNSSSAKQTSENVIELRKERVREVESEKKMPMSFILIRESYHRIGKPLLDNIC